jgi:asparagine synthase (glutamine-hydrolysing)
MCGFIAIFERESGLDVATAREALGRLVHRGPDCGGEWRERDVYLGHRRLAIIDLDAGAQPMQSADGRHVVVFNGEIYNFPELRKRLIQNGVQLRTHSDTEVIIEGYRYWGDELVNELHGMFAFVIWDRVRRSVFAARDRLGIKPLIWTMMRSGALILSSTLEPFSVLAPSDLTYDPLSVRDLMTFDYIPVPRTIYRGVHKLEPGTTLEWAYGMGDPKVRRYWSPPVLDAALRPPDEFELENLLEAAVKRQMISDVPIGAFLSGGIDSSLLVAMMARHTSQPVRTFSVAFTEGGVDESPISSVVATRFATEHTVLHAEDFDAGKLLQLIGELDEPFCDPALVPTYILSRLTKQHVKVALSGDGGDEVFGGYPKYLLGENGHSPLPFGAWLDQGLRALPWRPRGMGHLYWRTLTSAERVRFAWTRYGDFPIFRKDLRQLLAPSYQENARIQDYFEPWERRAERYGRTFETDVLMRTDLETYLSENCLVKTDRASMLASLEVRVPYLDETILDRILPLPSSSKIPGGELKALLMPIARRLLPREVWDRPKHGFTVPLSIRLAGAWRPALESVLDWGEENLPWFDYGYLRRLHKINRASGGIDRELWNPFVFLAWSMAHAHRA